MGWTIRAQFLTTRCRPESSGSNLRRLSISFSQEIIWFEVGMLWDAKFTQTLKVTVGSFDKRPATPLVATSEESGRNRRGLDIRLQVSRGASEYSIPIRPYCRNV